MLDTIVGLLYETRNQRDTLTNRAEQLEGSLRGASAGDLRLRVEESSDVVGRLASAFNLTLNRFRRFISGSQAVIVQMETVRSQIGERSSSLSRQARLEATRFVHLGAVAENLAEQMRLAQAGSNEAILAWQRAAEALQAGEVIANRTIEEAQGVGSSVRLPILRLLRSHSERSSLAKQSIWQKTWRGGRCVWCRLLRYRPDK